MTRCRHHSRCMLPGASEKSCVCSAVMVSAPLATNVHGQHHAKTRGHVRADSQPTPLTPDAWVLRRRGSHRPCHADAEGVLADSHPMRCAPSSRRNCSGDSLIVGVCPNLYVGLNALEHKSAMSRSGRAAQARHSCIFHLEKPSEPSQMTRIYGAAALSWPDALRMS
jgi:hypothetical protein